MFKNIQKNLLLRHPLLWNTRIIPVLAIATVLHVIFFIIGYVHGAIDFTPSPEEYYFDVTTGIITFFSIAISILIFIFWLVYYTRNNAFKSFYPKSSISLFKEWLIILLVCIINSAYFGSYLYGEDLRARGYFTEEEFSTRLDAISMVSLFADGGFQQGEYYYEEINGDHVQKRRDSFDYNERKFSLKSLINKSISEFSYQSSKEDSLNEVKVKGWLLDNKKDSVLAVMKKFHAMAEEHGAKSNISADKWLSIVYNYPGFTDYITVGRTSQYEQDDHSSRYGQNNVISDDMPAVETAVDDIPDMSEIDTISNTIRVVDGRTIVFPRYYVPLKQLEDSYSEISKAYTSPSVNEGFLLAVLYFSLCFSLAIFSFRVTSGRDWIIALLAFGVTALVTGILQITVSSAIGYSERINYRDNFYWVMWLIIVGVLVVLFLKPKVAKGKSAIFLNIVLWLCPWVVISLFAVAKDFMYIEVIDNNISRWQLSPTGQWIDDNTDIIMAANALIIIIFMLFMTKAIKRWKGVAEA